MERLTKDRSYESNRIGDDFSQRVSNQFVHAYEDYYGDNGFDDYDHYDRLDERYSRTIYDEVPLMNHEGPRYNDNMKTSHSSNNPKASDVPQRKDNYSSKSLNPYKRIINNRRRIEDTQSTEKSYMVRMASKKYLWQLLYLTFNITNRETWKNALNKWNRN